MSDSREDEKPAAVQAGVVKKTPALPSVDLKSMLTRGHLILEAELKRLSAEAAKGLLDGQASAVLVNYLKIIKEMVKDEDALLNDMSDEELEKLVKDKK